MSDRRLDRWFQHLRGELPGGLDDLLHDDCTFWSPIVFTPQRGKALTAAYLEAAGQTLGGDGHEQVTLAGDGHEGRGDGGDETQGDEHEGAEHDDEGREGDQHEGGFRYVKVVADGHHAVLEFETTMDGTYVNGVDIITFDADGKIVDFKVMVRPLRAVNEVHARMKTMLEQMAEAAGADGP